MDIRKYLQFLDDDGWSELIDERWKGEVKQLLTIGLSRRFVRDIENLIDHKHAFFFVQNCLDARKKLYLCTSYNDKH